MDWRQAAMRSRDERKVDRQFLGIRLRHSAQTPRGRRKQRSAWTAHEQCDARSTAGSAGPAPAPKAAPARSSNGRRHSVTWFGCLSCYWSISTTVLSPRTASSATLALKAAKWLRRGRLLMLSAPVTQGSIPAHRSSRSTFGCVQSCAATSFEAFKIKVVGELRADGRADCGKSADTFATPIFMVQRFATCSESSVVAAPSGKGLRAEVPYLDQPAAH